MDHINVGQAESSLCIEEKVLYRKTSATLNYLAQDRPDLNLASHALARRMTDPDQEDMSRARQVMKYLMEHPELKIIFEWQETDGIIDVYTDSD